MTVVLNPRVEQVTIVTSTEEVAPASVTVVLTPHEAAAILAIGRKCTGSSDGPRGGMSTVSSRLLRAIFKDEDYTAPQPFDPLQPRNLVNSQEFEELVEIIKDAAGSVTTETRI